MQIEPKIIAFKARQPLKSAEGTRTLSRLRSGIGRHHPSTTHKYAASPLLFGKRTGYHGRYLTRWKRTDAKRVYGFCGCRKRAVALLRDSTDLQIRKSQDGSARVSASCPGPFSPRFYAVRSPFSRAQVKSYYPLCDRCLKALEIGRWIGPKCVGWYFYF